MTRSKIIVTNAFCSLSLLVCLQPSLLSAEHKEIKAEFNSGKYTSKIMRISGFLAAEIVEKGAKAVRVEPFKDAKGRETEENRLVRDSFIKALSSAEQRIVVISAGKADAILSGILIPFKGREKWRLRIKVVHAATGELITSYEGYY